MKQTLLSRNILRAALMGAAVTTASFSFTSCTDEPAEAQDPIETLQAGSENGAIIQGKYIVVFNNGTLRLDQHAPYEKRLEMVRIMGQAILSSHSIGESKIEQAFGQAILGVSAELSAAEVNQLRKDDRVAYIEPDRMFALAKPGTGGGGSSSSQEVPWGVTRVGYGDGTGKTAWVLDSGIDLDHPDLKVDVSRSRTFITSGKDARDADDGNGHGSHVAGTIAALNNTIGVVGVAHGATVVAVKVLNSQGSGAYSGVIAGVDYVAANAKAGDVANMSLGGPVSQALDDAVLAAAAKGVKFALAAGNESADANNSSPARVNHANVYTVSAMNSAGVFASFSNYGNPPIDYCAPGVNIKSTWKGGGYSTISGTSMASPHVAGLLLLGSIQTDGYVTGDKDNNPDPIAHR
ncbi:S8 family serine peptidase [Pontibacter sp. 13R65]|uniref:S8 family serine peptidase n=1 Tax=Pontibacter sp. 13R65 TaxID=3127458 RepID=UPI00301C14B1